MSNCHPNINLTIEISTKKFLDNQIITKSEIKETAVYRQSTKLPVSRSSNKPKPKRISTNFDEEIYRIKKFLAEDYPQKFVECIICNFEIDKIESVGDDYIIPLRFFKIVKPIMIVKVYFPTNYEVSPKQFM